MIRSPATRTVWPAWAGAPVMSITLTSVMANVVPSSGLVAGGDVRDPHDAMNTTDTASTLETSVRRAVRTC